MAKNSQAAAVAEASSQPAGSPVPAADELTDTREKLNKTIAFLRWLANTTKSDWDLRRRVIAALRDIGAWDS